MSQQSPAFTTPLPSEVPGYQQALAAGLLPVVPATPPQLLPGVSAAAYIRTRVIVFVIGFFLAVILGHVIHGAIGNGLAGLVIVGILIYTLAGILSNSKRILRECRAGYATQKIIYTGSSFSAASRAVNISNGGRVGWNFDGVWMLKANGSVISAPDRVHFAPGYYPSPHSSGEFELWTGSHWNGSFRTEIPA